MNYIEWAEEYDLNAFRVKSVIDRKKQRLNEQKLSADLRKQLIDEIAAYRRIYRELVLISDKLRDRAGVGASEA